MYRSADKKKIIHALEIALQDASFSAAPKMSAFLRYVVMQTLEGNGGRIKAYNIGIDALHKPSTFDPQNDPSVRVLAKRLRDTLSDYYSRTAGHEVVLLLKPGSYVPQFIVLADDIRPQRIVELLEKGGKG